MQPGSNQFTNANANKLRKNCACSGKTSLKMAGLLSGIGGLDLGFGKAGFETAFANGNWKAAWKHAN